MNNNSDYIDYINDLDYFYEQQRLHSTTNEYTDIVLKYLNTNNIDGLINYFTESISVNKYQILEVIISKNNLDVLKNLLNFFPLFNVNHNNLLSIAIRSRSFDCGEYLISLGADVSCTNNIYVKECVTLPNASKFVELLIEHGADIHADDDLPLLNAVNYGKIENIKVLLKYSANIKAINWRALFTAIHMNHFCIFTAIIDTIDDINCDNGIILEKVIEIGNYPYVLYVLTKGADISYLRVDTLIIAIQRRCLETINLLIEYGVDFSIVNQNKFDMDDSNQKVVTTLLNQGVDSEILCRVWNS